MSAIRSTDEYLGFIEKHKTSPPEPISFKFDDSLLDGTHDHLPDHLNKTSLLLNDLTIDTLKARQKDVDEALGDCRKKIMDKQTAIIQQETELQAAKIKSDPASIARMFAVKKTMDGLKKDVNELRCVEQKLSRQSELISKPIKDLGCEQAPPGCDTSAVADLIMDGVPHHNNYTEAPTTTTTTTSSSTSGTTGTGKRRSLAPSIHSLNLNPVGSGSSGNQMISKMLKNPFGSAGGIMNSNKSKTASTLGSITKMDNHSDHTDSRGKKRY